MLKQQSQKGILEKRVTGMQDQRMSKAFSIMTLVSPSFKKLIIITILSFDSFLDYPKLPGSSSNSLIHSRDIITKETRDLLSINLMTEVKQSNGCQTWMPKGMQVKIELKMHLLDL